MAVTPLKSRRRLVSTRRRRDRLIEIEEQPEKLELHEIEKSWPGYVEAMDSVNLAGSLVVRARAKENLKIKQEKSCAIAGPQGRALALT